MFIYIDRPRTPGWDMGTYGPMGPGPGGARPTQPAGCAPGPGARAHGPTWAHIISEARRPRPILTNIYIYIYTYTEYIYIYV